MSVKRPLHMKQAAGKQAHRQFITNMARNWFSNLSCCWQSMQSVVKHSGHDKMASERCDLHR